MALYAGMRLHKDWLNPTNNGYIVFDVVIGTLLVASAYGVIPTQEILIVTAIVTHLLRDYDYIKKLPERYALNTPLLVVLNIRLIMLIAILAL
jgi:hypothetical protein